MLKVIGFPVCFLLDDSVSFSNMLLLHFFVKLTCLGAGDMHFFLTSSIGCVIRDWLLP